MHLNIFLSPWDVQLMLCECRKHFTQDQGSTAYLFNGQRFRKSRKRNVLIALKLVPLSIAFEKCALARLTGT